MYMIYGVSDCPHCLRAQALCMEKDVDYIWVMTVGICGLTAHFCITKALALAPAIVVIPLDFLRLPLISLIGFLAYDEAFEWTVLFGAMLIFAAVFVNLQAEHQRNRTASKG